MNKKVTIDFIGIGAEKSGTTWLADMLRQHPEVFIPRQKELHYFNEKFVEDPKVQNYNSKKDIEWYLRFFEGARDGQLMGEFSPSYLWSDGSAKRIHNFFPNAKIIVILRNPATRAFSQYLYYFQKGIIQEENFLVALEKYPYLEERSLYYKQIKKYIDCFGKDQVLIFFFEELLEDKRKFLTIVEYKLGIKKWIPKDIDKKSNVTGLPKNKIINRFLGRSRIFFRKLGWNWIFDLMRYAGVAERIEKFRNNNKVKYQEKPTLSKSELQHLRNVFLEDIEKLEKLLGVDLSIWKNEIR